MEVTKKAQICSLPHCQWHFKVLPYPSLFSRHRAGSRVLGNTTDVWFLHLLPATHHTTAPQRFCSVLSFHETAPEFPAKISALKTPAPSTWYLYSANRIKNLSLLIFVFMDQKITQHFPTSFTSSLFVSSLFSTKGISLPIFFFPVSIDMRKKYTTLQKFSQNPPTKLNILALLLLS